MEQICFFCGHKMTTTTSRLEMRDGKIRQLTEFVCTNPYCGNEKVLDRPYEG